MYSVLLGTNYRGPEYRKGIRGTTILHLFFNFLDIIIIRWLYKLTPTDLAQVTLQLRVSLSDLAGPLLRKTQNVFHRASNPLSAVLPIQRHRK